MIIIDFIRDTANYGKVPDYEVVFFAVYLETIYKQLFKKLFLGKNCLKNKKKPQT